MKKRKKNTQEYSSYNNKTDESFGILIDSYTYALKDNSDMISAMLKELTSRELSQADKNTLDSISKDIKKIDRSIKKLEK